MIETHILRGNTIEDVFDQLPNIGQLTVTSSNRHSPSEVYRAHTIEVCSQSFSLLDRLLLRKPIYLVKVHYEKYKPQ